MPAARLDTLTKNKTNINPVVDRSTEVTAEDFANLGAVINDHATRIDSFTGASSPNKSLGVYTSLTLLQAAHPSANAGDYAIIDAGIGASPQIAVWNDTTSQWDVNPAASSVVYVVSLSNLPTPGVSETLYITTDNYAVYTWHNSQYNLLSTPLSLPTQEKLIQGMWVDTRLNVDNNQIEVGNTFRGWLSNRYVVGKVLQVPINFATDVDDPTKIALVTDNADNFQKIPLTVNNLFNYLPFEISSFNDENFYSKNLDILSNFKANTVIGAGITYVDAINGLDTNNGAQISRPKKTIASALALGSSTILLKNGYYDKFDWRFDSPLGNRSRVIIGIGDNVVFGVKGDVLQSFITSPFGTATLQMTLVTNNNLLVLTRKDQLDNDGQPTPIPKRASATEVNSSGYGWFYDTATKLLTIRLDDPTPHGANATERELWFNSNIAPLLKPIYTPATNPFIRAYSNHIYFKNCKFEGIYLWALKHAANPKSSIYLDNCELKYSPGGGLIVDNSDYVLKDTYITRSQGDNIGVHEQTAGTVPEGIEINLKSTYAGDTDTYGTAIVENKNASSVHENCNVIRIGGEYAYSFGPNIIDVGVDANSVGVSYNLNVKAHTSLATTSNADFETYNFRKVYLSNCKALYNGKIAVRTNAEIIYHNLIYNNILLQTGGVFTKYQF